MRVAKFGQAGVGNRGRCDAAVRIPDLCQKTIRLGDLGHKFCGRFHALIKISSIGISLSLIHILLLLSHINAKGPCHNGGGLSHFIHGSFKQPLKKLQIDFTFGRYTCLLYTSSGCLSKIGCSGLYIAFPSSGWAAVRQRTAAVCT